MPTPTDSMIRLSKKDDHEHDFEEEINRVNWAVPKTDFECFYLKLCETCGKYLPSIKYVSYHLQKNPTHTVIRKNVLYIFRLIDDIADKEVVLPNDAFKQNGFIFNDIPVN